MESLLSRARKLDRRLTINVGGVSYQTLRSTLERKPGTRLATMAILHERDESWDPDCKEFFYDRHPGVFASILHYYRTDELHTDHNICGNIIRGELEYWGLTELDIEPCCWGNYSRFKEHKDTLADLDENFTLGLDEKAWGEKPSSLQKFKKRIWMFLEDPASSRWAKVYAVVSMFFVVLSIAVFCLETHSWFRVPLPGVTLPNTTSLEVTSRGDGACCCKVKVDELPSTLTEPHDAMKYMDYLCAAFFTFEYLMRLFFAPRKLVFIRQPLNVIDILCLLPHFIAITIKTINPADSASHFLKSVLALRIVRVLRIFKLMKHYTAFKILVYTIKVSTKELCLMVIFLFSGVLIFASIIYYAENATFNNIPIGFWWALVTMTTVGYGDKVPVSEGGYIIGFMCVLCGVLTVAFTVPIVVNNFTLYYAHAQSRVRLPEKKRKELQRKLLLKNQRATDFIKKLTINVANRKKNKREFSVIEDVKKKEEPSTDANKNIGASYKPKTAAEDRWNRSLQGSRITTVSECVTESMELPNSPISLSIDEGQKSAQQIETEQLLSDLHGKNEKLKEERRRQLDMVNTKREQKRQARMTPRPSPAPAAAAKSQPAPVETPEPDNGETK
ncbi:potassium voltage-gated channel protein Shaw-like [Haliotis cracherodii]|uniref:potassium voltage-gated channel protein Shaw-like n=1 Tax=Haliotis cracherodii TaxID=6455 RepID=UPI0039ED77A1